MKPLECTRDGLELIIDSIDIIDFLNYSEEFRKFAEENGLIGSNRI